MPLPAELQARLEQAFAWHQADRLAEAAAGYQAVLAVVPDDIDANRLLGTVAFQQGRFRDALALIDRSLAGRAGQPEAWLIQGNCWLALQRFDAALTAYDRAIGFCPRFAEAHANRGDALRYLGRMGEAAASYDRALAFDPGLPWVAGLALYSRLFLADWRDAATRRDALLRRVADGERAATPLLVQSLNDSGALQRRAAETFTAARFPSRGLLPPLPVFQPGERIRVAYLSNGFRDHPVAHLTAGLFEHHDRARFEIFVLSLGAPVDDPWRRRIQAAADPFIDVAAKSDLEITALIRELGIAVAVDLDGYSDINRTAILAERAAPVQVGYLGYPGSLGAPFVDYLLADAVLVPDGDDRFYSETVVRLPCFQVNDDRLTAAAPTPSRADLGLPETGFVFACFNQTYKLLPEVFDGWMRILAQVSDSVLWLYPTDPAAVVNLRREAEHRGIDPERLVFAGRLPLDRHLARLRQADLFLDTFPYNAGATASHALRMGLPLVTRPGEAFASRMGASLLTAVGLPDLIAATPDDYEALAVRLATSPAALAEVRQRLADNLPGSRLFDTKQVTRDIEAAYAGMIDRLVASQCLDTAD